jgi:hypothetical protein
MGPYFLQSLSVNQKLQDMAFATLRPCEKSYLAKRKGAKGYVVVSKSSFDEPLEFLFIHNEFSPFNIAIVALSLFTSLAE